MIYIKRNALNFMEELVPWLLIGWEGPPNPFIVLFSITINITLVGVEANAYEK